MKRTALFLLLLILTTGSAFGEVESRSVEYSAGEIPLQGYFAWDSSVDGKRPAVLVVHEWWGLNDYARTRARMLANLGYAAFALDMYGNGKTTTHPETAKKFSSQLRSNTPLARERFEAALKALKEQPEVDPEKIAAIGYCFGGGIVLQMARAGMDLDAVVSFHGSLPTEAPPQPSTVKARVLVLHGGADPLVSEEQLTTFKKQMEAAGADYRLVIYGGAKHSFTNPEADDHGKKHGMPLAYDPQADKASSDDMKAYLSETFE